MATNSSDETGPLESEGLTAPTAEPLTPRLRLHHLFALTAVMAVLLAVNGPQRSFSAPQFEPPRMIMQVQTGLNLLNQIVAAVAITALGYGIADRRCGQPFFNQPGHWILVDLSLVTLLSIPMMLALRSIDFTQPLELGDWPMMVMMIAGLYSLIFVVLGRLAINIYIAVTKCTEPRWRNVFIAKAVAAMVAGLGDIAVAAFLAYAVQRDRGENVPRDASHWCGVVVQLALSGLVIIGAVVGLLTMAFLFWNR